MKFFESSFEKYPRRRYFLSSQPTSLLSESKLRRVVPAAVFRHERVKLHNGIHIEGPYREDDPARRVNRSAREEKGCNVGVLHNGNG